MLHLTMPALSYTTFHAAFETEPDVPISDPFSSQLHQHEAVHYRWSHHDSHGVTGIDLGFGEQSRDYADIPGPTHIGPIHSLMQFDVISGLPQLQLIFEEQIAWSPRAVEQCDLAEMPSIIKHFVD